MHLYHKHIIAPENANSGGTYWEDFEEVWQYGSNLGQPNQDPMWEQDGVAPQCPVPDIKTPYLKTKTGRVFIPKSWAPKGFVECHTIGNYGWIFKEKKEGDDGYVKQRK